MIHNARDVPFVCAGPPLPRASSRPTYESQRERLGFLRLFRSIFRLTRFFFKLLLFLPGVPIQPHFRDWKFRQDFFHFITLGFVVCFAKRIISKSAKLNRFINRSIPCEAERPLASASSAKISRFKYRNNYLHTMEKFR